MKRMYTKDQIKEIVKSKLIYEHKCSSSEQYLNIKLTTGVYLITLEDNNVDQNSSSILIIDSDIVNINHTSSAFILNHNSCWFNAFNDTLSFVVNSLDTNFNDLQKIRIYKLHN